MIALVLGGARCVWDDVRAFKSMWGVHGVELVAVNEVGIHLPSMEHWATLHPECFYRVGGDEAEGWLERRFHQGIVDMRRSVRSSFQTWGPADKPAKVDRRLETRGRGSSGYFGVEVAKHLGADRVILCGIPMTPTPHFDSDEPWEMAEAHWKHWPREHERGKLRGVRSMSGRTRDLLGAPTPEWLAAVADDTRHSPGEILTP